MNSERNKNKEEYLQLNKLNWDERVKFHTRSAMYDLENFKKGKSSLCEPETTELGDINGKSLLHLQCHFGEDTLSLARMGPESVVGVDFSTTAIKEARSLSEELGINNVRFIESDIYKVSSLLQPQEFDIVFTSTGILCWLPDLDEWAKLIYHFLKPGGFFYISEVHPIVDAFEQNVKGEIVIANDYFKKDPSIYEQGGTYADWNAKLENNKCIEWAHTLGDVINALIKAGLVIEFLHEFPFIPWKPFSLLEGKDGHYVFPDNMGKLPLTFSVKARKK